VNFHVNLLDFPFIFNVQHLYFTYGKTLSHTAVEGKEWRHTTQKEILTLNANLLSPIQRTHTILLQTVPTKRSNYTHPKTFKIMKFPHTLSLSFPSLFSRDILFLFILLQNKAFKGKPTHAYTQCVAPRLLKHYFSLNSSHKINHLFSLKQFLCLHTVLEIHINFYLWQSLTVSTLFFLGYSPQKKNHFIPLLLFSAYH